MLVEVQRLAANAWIAQAKGDPTTALRSMRAAADLEDGHEKHIVTPGRVLPARELLGEMLLAMKQPAEALKAFEATRKDRANGVLLASRAQGLVDQSGNIAPPPPSNMQSLVSYDPATVALAA